MLVAEGSGRGYRFERAPFVLFKSTAYGMFYKWSGMLQFCKCPAGGPGSDNSCVRFTSELSRCCLRTVSVLPLCKIQQSPSPPGNPKYTAASKQYQGKFIYRRRGICFSPNLIKARSGKETLLHCLDRSSIYRQPEQPREARRGRGKHTAGVRAQSNLPAREMLWMQKGKRKIFHLFVPLQVCILKDYKPKEKFARIVQ